MPLVTLYLLKRLSEEEYQMTNFVRYWRVRYWHEREMLNKRIRSTLEALLSLSLSLFECHEEKCCCWIKISWSEMAEKARTPMARVVSRQTIVRTAEDFAKTGADACPGIQFIHVSKTEVEESIGWPRWPCFLWRKTPSWHKECPPYGGLLRSCFVLAILYSICNKWLHSTISKYFQVLGQNKIKVQPFKEATKSKEHRL